MATKATFTMKGFEEYFEAIRAAGNDIDAAAERALIKGSDIMLAEMIALVPIKTGHLMQTLAIKGPIRDGNYTYVEVGIIHDIAFTDKDTAIQANVMEYGNATTAAQPFIRPAIARKRRAVMKAIRESLKAEGLAD